MWGDVSDATEPQLGSPDAWGDVSDVSDIPETEGNPDGDVVAADCAIIVADGPGEAPEQLPLDVHGLGLFPKVFHLGTTAAQVKRLLLPIKRLVAEHAAASALQSSGHRAGHGDRPCLADAANAAAGAAGDDHPSAEGDDPFGGDGGLGLPLLQRLASDSLQSTKLGHALELAAFVVDKAAADGRSDPSCFDTAVAPRIVDFF
jgi:hypothetical protein